MYIDVEFICLIAQNNQLKNGIIFELLPIYCLIETIDDIFVYSCGK